MPSVYRLLSAVILPVLLVLAVPRTGRADEEEEPRGELRPVLVFNVAGVDRILEDVSFAFESAGRKESMQQLQGLLERVNDLKGLTRSKSLGMMLFLKPGMLVPTPTPVVYVPVEKIDDLVETMELGPVSVRKADGAERYEIVGPRRTLSLKVRGDFALISNDSEILGEELPNPQELTRALSTRYDLSLSVLVKNVPEATRDFFLELLRNSANAELQQRDDEPRARYELRKANGKQTFELIELLLTQGEELVIGWDSSATKRKAVLEVVVEATPDSKFAQLMQDFGGKSSLFGEVFAEGAPLALSSSWVMSENGRDVVQKLLSVAEVELSKAARRIEQGEASTPEPADGERPAEPELDRGVSRLIAPLKATAGAGHVDGFAQFEPQSSGRMVLVGGLKLAQADEFASALTDFLLRIKEDENLKATVETSAEAHRGVTFHRVAPQEVRSEDERIYGGTPVIYVGAGRRALWFAVGTGNPMSTLRPVMDGVIDSKTNPRDRDPDAPFRLAMNAKRWMGLEPNPNAPRRFRELAEQAFGPGQDGMRVDLRPIENGARLRVVLDEGFIRMFGLGVARRLERGDRGRRPREGAEETQDR